MNNYNSSQESHRIISTISVILFVLLIFFIVLNFLSLSGESGSMARMFRMYKKDPVNLILQTVVTALLLLICLYHFLIWTEFRGSKASNYLLLFCLVIFFRLININNFFNLIIPNLLEDWNELNYKFIFFSYSLGWVLFPGFIRALYPRQAEKVILLVLQSLGILMTAVILLFSYPIYSRLLMYYDFVTLAGCGWILYVLIKAWIAREEGAAILLLGMAIYSLSIGNDIIQSYRMKEGFRASEWGLVIFLFLHSKYLSRQFSKAYETAAHLSTNLQKEVTRKTRQMESEKQKAEGAYQQLKESDKYKTEFFQNISHEFKTPLTLILGPLELLFRHPFFRDHQEEKEQLNIIRANALQLLSLINQLLDLPRLEAGQIEIQRSETDLVELIKEGAGEFIPMAEQKEISFHFYSREESLTMSLDRNKIKSILTNLLSNAFKYNHQGGSVEVHLDSPVYRKGSLDGVYGTVEVTVKDTGIGIPKKELPHIFDRFRRVHRTNSSYDGTGIGLAIVKEYISLHGGDIYVKSEENRGTAITFALPVESSTRVSDSGEKKEIPLSREQGEKKADLPPLLRKKEYKDHTILIVEDNFQMRRYVKNILEKYYHVYEAPNGARALEMLKDLPRPDLVLSDIMMETMDGYTFHKELIRNNEYKELPFIFLTARSGQEEKLKGLSMGAVDYLFKPFSVQELLYKIDNILKNQQMTKAFFEKDKYASIGMLFGGIAHEILNPLGGIYAPLENLQRQLEKNSHQSDPRTEKYFNQIFDSLERIEKLVKSSRLLFYQKAMERETVDIPGVLSSIEEIFKNRLKNNITLTTRVDDDLSLETDYGALTHIFLNVISNAIDAIEEKRQQPEHRQLRGEIKIEITSRHILIRDNGTGISPEDQTRIFDPFYTRKAPGKGTGIGLWIVKMLILRMNWQISINSRKGEYTTFLIRITE